MFLSAAICLVQFGAHADSAECSKRDLINIQKFDKKADRYIKKHIELMQDVDKGRLKDKRFSDNLSDDLERIDRFFNSEEFRMIAPVYERCGKDIPQIQKSDPPFWPPLPQ